MSSFSVWLVPEIQEFHIAYHISKHFYPKHTGGHKQIEMLCQNKRSIAKVGIKILPNKLH